MKVLFSLVIIVGALSFIAQSAGNARSSSNEKATSLKGKVYRETKNHPVGNAVIILLDEKKAGNRDNSVESNTDDEGNYLFAKVVEGKYTVSIRTWYNSEEDVPCQLMMAKTKDKDSSLLVMKDKDKYVEQVFIKGFSVKAGKERIKDFDIACKGMFGN